MTDCKPAVDMSGLDKALGTLVTAQISLGKELISVLSAGSSLLWDGAKGLKLPRGDSCCNVPEPCWMPKSLGELNCTLKRGDVGEVCIIVVNEDFRSHDYTISASGPDSGAVAIARPSFTLGPKERATVSVKVTVPKEGRPSQTDSCCDCDALDVLLWVRGCNSFYLRWKICVAEKSKDCCHRVCVEDVPDYELHWYDHFHVLRPCPTTGGHERMTGGQP